MEFGGFTKIDGLENSIMNMRNTECRRAFWYPKAQFRAQARIVVCGWAFWCPFGHTGGQFGNAGGHFGAWVYVWACEQLPV